MRSSKAQNEKQELTLAPQQTATEIITQLKLTQWSYYYMPLTEGAEVITALNYSWSFSNASKCLRGITPVGKKKKKSSTIKV